MPIALVILLVKAGESAPSAALTAVGIALTTAGELLRIWAVRHIGTISRTRSGRLGPLVSSGPFGIVRNPLYVGNVAIWTGFACVARLLWIAPFVAAVLAVEYAVIVRWEEQLLESRYGNAYRDYATRVPRWMPRMLAIGRRPSGDGSSTFPGPSSSPSFGWRDTLFSERGTLIAVAAGYVLVWLKLHR